MTEPQAIQADAGGVVAEMKRTVDLLLEHNRKGYDVTSLLFHAQKLVGQLADNPSAVAVIAGYQMKATPRVFYPADWRPTDINNFLTLVYAPADAAPAPVPHYVLRYVDKVGGPLGDKHALVSIADWNNGMSGAVAERVCDAHGQPLTVWPGPVSATTSSAETSCS